MEGRKTAGRQGGAEILHLRQAAAGGAGQALEKAYLENRPALVSFLQFRLGSHSEAEDVAQAAFMQLWSRRDGLKDQNLVSLLFIAARNLATDGLRRRQRSPIAPRRDAGPASGFEDVADEYPSAERALIAQKDVSLIRSLLEELPPKCREAFISYRFRAHEYATIAQDMGVTESMVRKYVRRALTHCVARFAELDAWE